MEVRGKDVRLCSHEWRLSNSPIRSSREEVAEKSRETSYKDVLPSATSPERPEGDGVTRGFPVPAQGLPRGVQLSERELLAYQWSTAITKGGRLAYTIVNSTRPYDALSLLECKEA